MYKLYIDKENIESIVKNRNKNKVLYNKFVNAAMENQLSIHYNFTQADIEVNDYLGYWFEEIVGQGSNTEYTKCENPNKGIYPSRPVRKDKCLEKENKLPFKSIFILNITDEECTNLKKEKSLIIKKTGEEYKFLEELFKLEDSEEFGYKLINWSSYIPQLPITDIVLYDEHYFASKTTYEANKNELIKALSSRARNKVNIVIFTLPDKVDDKINLEKECKFIKKEIFEASQCSSSPILPKNINVTIITYKDKHSRHIITNYFRVKFDSCTHLQENNLDDDVTAEVKVYLKKSSYNITEELINKFQEIIDYTYSSEKKFDRRGIEIPKTIIYGEDKKSNFFKNFKGLKRELNIEFENT